jgi:hypothetical protein
MSESEDIMQLRQQVANLHGLLVKAQAERDDARREICINAANELSYELGGRIILARDEAKKRGWDCFKEKP